MIEGSLTTKHSSQKTKLADSGLHDSKSIMSKTFYSPRAAPKNNLFENEISLAKASNIKSGQQFQDMQRTK